MKNDEAWQWKMPRCQGGTKTPTTTMLTSNQDHTKAYIVKPWNRPGAHFTNIFAISIQIWWKFHFDLIQILKNQSQQTVSHAMAAQLRWHLQNIVATSQQETELFWKKLPTKFRKGSCDMGPRSTIPGHTFRLSYQRNPIYSLTQLPTSNLGHFMIKSLYPCFYKSLLSSW